MAVAVLMKIEREDKQMLEGLNSLIQLAQVQLEGQRTQQQNQNQVNSSVQQQGLQTQGTSQLQPQKLEAAYAKAAQQIFKK